MGGVRSWEVNEECWRHSMANGQTCYGYPSNSQRCRARYIKPPDAPTLAPLTKRLWICDTETSSERVNSFAMVNKPFQLLP